MHDIEMAEVTEEFARCWKAAATHIQNQAGGQLNSWLKANLTPPFLEHLSFRLGNQLIFIQIEDVDNGLEVPGNRSGLKKIAESCNGHACIMPMKKSSGEWSPALPNWGLQSLETQKPINPVEFITDEEIEITDWEVHDFAVQVVQERLKSQGKQIMSSQGNPHVDPSIWFVGQHGPEWVVVRATRYPSRKAERPNNLLEIAQNCSKLSSRGNFASVALANAKLQTDSTAVCLFRGHPAVVMYEGLEPI